MGHHLADSPLRYVTPIQPCQNQLFWVAAQGTLGSLSHRPPVVDRWIHHIHQPKRDQELSIDMNEILVSNDCSIKNIEFSQIHHRFSMIFHFSRCCSLICFGHCGCQTSNQLRRGGAHPLRRGWEEFEAGRQGYGRPWAAWGASVSPLPMGFALVSPRKYGGPWWARTFVSGNQV